MSYTLIGKVIGDNKDGKNRGGLVIELRGPQIAEVGRVAFDRTEGERKGDKFNVVVDEEIAKAQKAITAINELLSGAGKLQ